MKKYLVGLTLLASMSVYADPILDCDQNEIGNLIQTAQILDINEDFAVYSVQAEEKEAVLTVDRDCDFWDLEIIGQ